MTSNVLIQAPDIPITEVWRWPSDYIVATDGTSQTIELAALPKRSWTGNYVFDSVEDIRRHMASMFRLFKNEFWLPAYHESVLLKSPCLVGATTMACNTLRSDFRVGATALVIGGGEAEVVTITVVSPDEIEIAPGLVNAYKRAVICPLNQAYAGDNAAFTRGIVNGFATAGFTFEEYGYQDPFILEDDKETLELFGGLPVLNKIGSAPEYVHALSTGIEITDYGGMPSLRSQWVNPQWRMTQVYLCDRLDDPLDWRWWKTFADACRGGAHPFYLPSFRPDFDIYTEAVAAGTTVVLSDDLYSTTFAPADGFDKLVLTAEDGEQHFASVTNVSTTSGRDTLTFTPAVPAGDWSGQMLSHLLKCRIADDTVSTEHQGLSSFVTLNLETVDG